MQSMKFLVDNNWDRLVAEHLELTRPPSGFATPIQVPLCCTMLYGLIVFYLVRRRRSTANWRKAQELLSEDKDESMKLRANAMITEGSMAHKMLKRIQQLHNLALSFFSAVIFLGTLHACVTREWRLEGNGVGGLKGAICVEVRSIDNLGDGLRRMFHWYQLSKYWEYLDTLFLILNGKDLSFLHVYHHGVVAFTSWTWTRGDLRLAAGGVLFNTMVHVFMYYYYFACTIPELRKRLWWKKYLTKLQILQFIVALVMAVCLWQAHSKSISSGGLGCAGNNAFIVSTGFNATLLLLFVDFHIRSYGSKSKATKRASQPPPATASLKMTEMKAQQQQFVAVASPLSVEQELFQRRKTKKS